MRQGGSGYRLHSAGEERPDAFSAVLSTADRLKGWDRASLVLLLISTLLRLSLLSRLELVPDEAYYWDWSRHLSWGYYDQGPMIAYLIRLTTLVFGNNEFGVRLSACICSAITLICCTLLARRFFSPRAGFLTLMCLVVSPLMTVGSLIATYDPPLVCFWAITLIALERALFHDVPGDRPMFWLWAGCAAGCGLLSKHSMVLMLPCIVLFLLLSPQHRPWLLRPEPYFACLIAVGMYGGVLWWNLQHHGWTFGHLLFLTHKGGGAPLRRLGEFLGSQALLIGPVLFVGSLITVFHELKRSDNHSNAIMNPAARLTSFTAQRLFLLCTGVPVLVLFCLLALKAKVQANWAPCAWLSLVVLFAGIMDENALRSKPGARQMHLTFCAVLITGGALTLLLMLPGLRKDIGLHLPPDADVTNSAYGWRSLAARIQRLRHEMGLTGRPVFVSGNGYQYIALMAFYLPDHPETHDLFLHNRLDFYAAYVERLKAHMGEDSLFINAGEANDADLRLVFTQVKWQPPFPIWRRPLYTEPITYIHLAKCHSYRKYTGLAWARGG